MTDKGSDQVVRFDPAARVTMVFGRKHEASDEGTAPLKHPKPPLPPVDRMFRQVTHIAWDSDGNGYISDGYINAHIAKVSKTGEWLGSLGSPGRDPGRIYKMTLDDKILGVLGRAGKMPKQFGWIHEIACPSENTLFVAELLNWRIQKLLLHP